MTPPKKMTMADLQQERPTLAAKGSPKPVIHNPRKRRERGLSPLPSSKAGRQAFAALQPKEVVPLADKKATPAPQDAAADKKAAAIAKGKATRARNKAAKAAKKAAVKKPVPSESK